MAISSSTNLEEAKARAAALRTKLDYYDNHRDEITCNEFGSMNRELEALEEKYPEIAVQ